MHAPKVFAQAIELAHNSRAAFAAARSGVPFSVVSIQGVSELIKRIAFLSNKGPDVLSSEENKSDEQKHLEQLEAQTARLLAGDK